MILVHEDKYIAKGVDTSLSVIADVLGFEKMFIDEALVKQSKVNETVFVNVAPWRSFELYNRHAKSVRFSHPKIVNLCIVDNIKFLAFDEIMKRQMAFSLVTFPTVFNSMWTMKHAEEFVRGLVSFSMFANRKWVVAPLGIDKEKIKTGTPEGKTDYLISSTFFNTRASLKGTDRVIEVAKKFHALTGKKLKIRVVSKEEISTAEGIEFELIGPRAEKYENFAKVKAFVSLSRDETYGLYQHELMQSGAVGVFFKARYVEELFVGYPYVYDNMDDVVACLASVESNYDSMKPAFTENVATLDDFKKKVVEFVNEVYI